MPTHSKWPRRRALRAHRRGLVAARRLGPDADALARGALDLLARLGLGSGATVLSYESLPVEPPTAALNRALAAAGVRVLVPDTLEDMDLDWHEAADPEGCRLGRDAVADADLVLAPGLAVDLSGTRMGQGGGCYDRALTRLRQGVAVVVLLHPGEVVGAGGEPLPREPHDRPVDAVLTADGYTGLGPGTDR